MADYSDLITALNNNKEGAKVNVRNSKIHTPSDQDGKQEDLKVEYDLMDLICGIAGAALFGKPNMNDTTKLSSLISGNVSETSLYSHVKQIHNILGNTKSNPLYVRLSDKTVGSSVQSISFSGSGNIADTFASLIDSLKGEGINTGIVKYLKKSLDHGGDLYNIFENLNKIGNNDKYKEIQEYVYNLNSIIESLVKLTNIGLIARLRIRLNLNFIKNYINNDLLEIIQDIDNNFKNLNNIEGLDNVNDLFNIISTLGQIDESNKLKMYINLKFIKHFLFKDIISIFEGINNTFNNNITETSVETINNLFSQILNNINIDKEVLKNAKKSIKSLKEILLGDSSIFGRSKIDSKNLNGIIGIGNIINGIVETSVLSLQNLTTINKFFKKLNTIIKDISNNDTIDIISVLSDKINYLNVVLSGISNIDTAGIKKTINSIVETLKELTDILKQNDYFDVVLDKLRETGEVKQQLDNTIEILNGISTISFDSDKLIKFFKDLEKIENVLSKFAANGKITSLGIESLNSLSEKLTVLIDSFNKIKPETIEQITNLVKEVEKFLLVSAGIFIIFGLLTAIKFGPIITFVINFAGLLLAIGGFIYILSDIDEKVINKAINTLKNIVLLIMQASIAFALITLSAAFGDIRNIWVFGAAFAVLLTVVGLITFGLSKLKYDKEQKNVTNFSSLILSLSAALALGALVSEFIHVGEIIAFGGLLALLIAVVSIPLFIIGKTGPSLMKGGKDLGILILYATAALLMGSLLMNIPAIKENVDEFANTFNKFVFKLLISVGLCSLLAKHGLNGIKELSKVVLITAAVLLIGALLMASPDIRKNINEFANILAFFIGAISIAIGLAGLMLGKKAIATAIALSVIISITATALILGPYLINKSGILYDDIIKFGIITLVYVLLFGLITSLLGLMVTQLALGAIGVVIIGALTIGIAWIFKESFNLMKDINWDILIEGFWNAAKVMGAIGGVLLVIAVLFNIPVVGQALMVGAAAAVALIAGIEALILGIAKCMSAASKAIIQLMVAKKAMGSESIESLVSIFGDFIVESAKAIDRLSLKDVAWIKTSLGAVKGIAKVTNMIAQSIQAYASLSVPLYNEEGKLIGRRNLKPEEFKAAAENIGYIITTIANAILDITKNKDGQHDPELVKLLMEPAGLFGTGTKFGKLIKSVGNIGKVISDIGKGLQDYASLKIPVYDNNGKIKGYRQMIDQDFTNAAKNIGFIITTVAQAIINIVENKDGQHDTELLKLLMEPAGMFGNDNKIGKLIKSVANIGKVISEIGKGLLDYANLKIPKYDKNGNVIGYREMKEQDFRNAATNIGIIVTELGKALVKTYNDNPNIFYGAFLSKSPIKRVIDVSIKLGLIISNIAHGIQDYANLRIPTKYDKDGKPIAYKPMGTEDFKAASKHIKDIITTIGTTLADVAEKDSRGLFDMGSSSPVTRVSEAILKVSTVMSRIANIIGYYSRGLFPIIRYTDGKMVTEGYVKINFENAQNNIKAMIQCLGNALYGSIKESKNLNKLFYNTVDIKKFEGVFNSIVDNMTKITNSIANIIKEKFDNNALNTFVSLTDTYLGVIDKFITKGTDKSKDIKSVFDEDGVLELTYNFLKKSLELVDDYSNKDRFNIFADGIAKIYIETIGKITKNDEFYKHTETLKTYVETINSIDISKVDKLTNLTDSLNEFGNRFEDMGSFVRAISVDLTTVLNHLADKMTEAKETIKNADKLNEKRKNSINESVKTITELMKQKLIVNIENTSNNSTGETPTPDSSTVTTTGTTPATTTITPKENIPAGDVTGDKGKSTPVQPFRGLGINNSTIETLLNGVIAGNAIRVKIINN